MAGCRTTPNKTVVYDFITCMQSYNEHLCSSFTSVFWLITAVCQIRLVLAQQRQVVHQRYHCHPQPGIHHFVSVILMNIRPHDRQVVVNRHPYLTLRLVFFPKQYWHSVLSLLTYVVLLSTENISLQLSSWV